jgi:predicted enzyme related to lactoylglutathione lyase
MNPVVHFEMPAEDPDRVKAFYAKAFGWQMQTMGPEMGNYILASTTETDEVGRPKIPGAINGGFYQKTDQHNVPSIVISVDDIHKAMQKVAQAGGTVLGGQNGSEPDVIPGVGLFVSIVDTEGNHVGLMQPVEMH